MYLAVLSFNQGQRSLLPIVEELGGTKPSPYCEKVLVHNDSCGLYKSITSSEDLEKRRRQAQRLVNEGQLISEEGVTYEAGGFD